MKSMRRKWREGKVRPTPGNSPHNRLVSRGIPSCSGEFATMPSRPLPFGAPVTHQAPRYAFFRHGGIYRSDVVGKPKPSKPEGGEPPPVGRPPASVKDATEGARLGSSSAMSSGRLFLDRVARQQSPSPLHRHPQINMHLPKARDKGGVSTLPERGHSYFALTRHRSRLRRSSASDILTAQWLCLNPDSRRTRWRYQS